MPTLTFKGAFLPAPHSVCDLLSTAIMAGMPNERVRKSPRMKEENVTNIGYPSSILLLLFPDSTVVYKALCQGSMSSCVLIQFQVGVLECGR